MVSHGSNKYSHAYLTVTQVFYTPSILLASNNRDGEKNIPDTKIIESKRLNEAIWMGPAFVLFFFSITFWNMTKLLSFDANFCVYISSSFFPVHLKVSNSLVFRYYRFFLLNNSVMEKMIYNLLLKASNETGDNKDILCTLYNCTFVDWQLHCSNGLKCHTVFFPNKN